MSADPWRVPDAWHVQVTQPPPPYSAPPPLVDWRRDSMVATLTAVLVALIGPVMGLVWSATTPKMSIRQIAAGSEAPFKAQIAADGRFLLLGVVAGVLCAAVVLALGEYGPGAVVGLAVGGLAAAFIADRVAIVAQHDGTIAALRSLGLRPSAGALDAVGFRVRALGVVTAWPIAAVTVHGLAVAFRPTAR